jgi:hypothetical protein
MLNEKESPKCLTQQRGRELFAFTTTPYRKPVSALHQDGRKRLRKNLLN